MTTRDDQICGGWVLTKCFIWYMIKNYDINRTFRMTRNSSWMLNIRRKMFKERKWKITLMSLEISCFSSSTIKFPRRKIVFLMQNLIVCSSSFYWINLDPVIWMSANATINDVSSRSRIEYLQDDWLKLTRVVHI